MPYPTKKHGQAGTKEHKVWKYLRQRTNDIEHSSYRVYASMDPRWECFATFLRDTGPSRPGAETIVRLDWRKPYGPENCRWGTRKEARAFRKPDHRTSKNYP